MSRLSAKLRPDPGRWFRSERYFNREFSWLQFNKRVLEEAENEKNPLLERLKFLAIFESNLDEFYMVRVSGLIEQLESGILDVTPDGLTPNDQLLMISETALPLRLRAGDLWERELRPKLAEAGVKLLSWDDLDKDDLEELEDFFQKEVFPLCTPLILHPAPRFPFISNRSLNLAIELEGPESGSKLARVKVPTVIPRIVRIHKRRHEYVMLEDLIANNLKYLFPGVTTRGVHFFRVIRDADIEIRELEAADLVSSIEETLRLRRFGDPVLLEINSSVQKDVREILMRALALDSEDVFEINGLIGLEALWELSKIDKPALRFSSHRPYLHDSLTDSKSIFNLIRKGDVFVHHPFDSFSTVEEFVSSASKDNDVIGIKQTLYRVGTESPIVESLLDAAEEGKQVAVMVELKARFDEGNNLEWARALERAGVHISYGFAEMKTHCKLCLIVRRERGKIVRYAHIGTGNYNPSTARTYTDFGLFTADEAICQDISELFNFLTGFSKQSEFRKLLVAPLNLREGILERIESTARHHQEHGNSRIVFKLNSLVDPEVIEALYEASNIGVPIELIVRGGCCLRPGVPGMSSNIRVRSVVGRFLEHTRVYLFEQGERQEAWIGSADMMRRNLDRRVEVLVPIEQPDILRHMRDVILESYLQDNMNTWVLKSDGCYERVQVRENQLEFETQKYLMNHSAARLLLPTEIRKK